MADDAGSQRVSVGVEKAQRADAALASGTEGLSRTRVQSLIRGGAVELNGETLLDPSRKVAPGDVLTVDLPPPEPATPAPESIPLAILYEDAAIVVIDKPAGLVVHPAAGHASGTLVNALLAHCGDSLSGIGGVARPGIVHRLDKDTSGVMVVAKSDAAHRSLSAQFADHGRNGPLRRTYTALVWGTPTPPDGTIDRPLGRHPSDRQRFAVRPNGKRAITHYRTEARFAEASRLACALETGRTHQIRVHMAAIGCPLVGDATYGGSHASKVRRLDAAAADAIAALGRQALHASTLTIAHPTSAERLTFTSAIPPDLANVIDALSATA